MGPENWQPLATQRPRWQENLESLRSTHARLADALEQFEPQHPYFLIPQEHRIQLGREIGGKIEPLANPVPPASARDIVRKLYGGGNCTEPLLIGGLDQGWLWELAYQLPCNTPRTPGHRPPLYLLARQIERLWVVMHLHDWTKLLADSRIQLFVGEDAAAQCGQFMTEHPHVPWPKLCVTVDPQIWPAGTTVDSLWQSAHDAANARMQQLSREVETLYVGTDAKQIARRIRGEQLRVLGITSRYTTFLKYSMSDWLDAFCTMGHDTLLVMERADHEITNPLYFADAVLNFKPDLILMIDHYRAEIAGLPRQIPCAMWVQDALPNIFSAKAGAAQGRRDYCLGFGRLHLRDQFGYPERRFLPAQVGVNEKRFAPRPLLRSDLDAYGCDISFVSHASTPATVLLIEQLNRADATGRKLLIDVFEQMRAVYDGGGMITHASQIGGMIQQSLVRCRFAADEQTRRSLYDFFTQKINNALFRHQALMWVVELDLNLHLWGKGWENHPRFGRYAKGVACNQSQLVTINQASRINLQLTPTGAVHQRLLDGLAAGGFFLMRYCPGDLADRLHKKLWEWCQRHNVQTHLEFMESMDAQVQRWLAEYEKLMGVGLLEFAPDVVAHLKLSADSGFARSAGTIWPEYADVCFDSRQRLGELAQQYLGNDALRAQTAESMRAVVLSRFTYRTISERLLEMIADDLCGDVSVVEAAA